jgi:hypothetical protein
MAFGGKYERKEEKGQNVKKGKKRKEIIRKEIWLNS